MHNFSGVLTHFLVCLIMSFNDNTKILMFSDEWILTASQCVDGKNAAEIEVGFVLGGSSIKLFSSSRHGYHHLCRTVFDHSQI